MASNKTIIGVGAAIAALYLFRTKLSHQPVPSVTTSEGFDLSPYGGPITYPDGIKQLAQAIARAEGVYVAGSVPQRAHNPGDLKLSGYPTLAGGISIFPDDNAGFDALYRQLYRILTNQSNYYSLDMTIADMARTWTATQQDSWARNVAGFLGVPTSTPLWEVMA